MSVIVRSLILDTKIIQKHRHYFEVAQSQVWEVNKYTKIQCGKYNNGNTNALVVEEMVPNSAGLLELQLKPVTSTYFTCSFPPLLLIIFYL